MTPPIELGCPACDGRKGSMVLVRLAGQGCVERWFACPICGGNGMVSQAQMERCRQGEALRKARLAEHKSLSEKARELGISPMALSHRETGREETP